MDLTAMFKDYASMHAAVTGISCRIFENKLMKREGTCFLFFVYVHSLVVVNCNSTWI